MEPSMRVGAVNVFEDNEGPSSCSQTSTLAEGLSKLM